MEYQVSACLSDPDKSDLGGDFFRCKVAWEQETDARINLSLTMNIDDDMSKWGEYGYDEYNGDHYYSRNTGSWRQIVRRYAQFIKARGIDWIIPGQSAWRIDLDGMMKAVSEIQNLSWTGEISEVPSLSRKEFRSTSAYRRKYLYCCDFYIYDPQVVADYLSKRRRIQMDDVNIPAEVQLSLLEFRRITERRKVAFIMMKYGQSSLHEQIVQSIKNTLRPWKSLRSVQMIDSFTTTCITIF